MRASHWKQDCNTGAPLLSIIAHFVSRLASNAKINILYCVNKLRKLVQYISITWPCWKCEWLYFYIVYSLINILTQLTSTTVTQCSVPAIPMQTQQLAVVCLGIQFIFHQRSSVPVSLQHWVIHVGHFTPRLCYCLCYFIVCSMLMLIAAHYCAVIYLFLRTVAFDPALVDDITIATGDARSTVARQLAMSCEDEPRYPTVVYKVTLFFCWRATVLSTSTTIRIDFNPS